VSFTAPAEVEGQQMASNWTVCQIRGGTDATPIAFFLNEPSQVQAGQLTLRINDFIVEASTYVHKDLAGYSLMGVELGGEFNFCSPQAGCATSTLKWRWNISKLELESPSATIQIIPDR
jgi:hypothetical protein